MNYRKQVLLIAIGFMPLGNQQVAAEELSVEAQDLIDFISVCRYKSASVEPNVQEALCKGRPRPLAVMKDRRAHYLCLLRWPGGQGVPTQMTR